MNTFSIEILYTMSTNHVYFKQVEARVMVMSKPKRKKRGRGKE